MQVRATGKLTRDDYERLAPKVEQAVDKLGKVRMLVDMADFQGADLGAAWEDVKFDEKHMGGLERIAMVGDKKWEKWMAKFTHPFSNVEVRIFDKGEAEKAQEWLAEGRPSTVLGSEHVRFQGLNRGMVTAWRLGLGQFLNRFPKQTGRVLVLTTMGRKTGTPRRTPLNYAPAGGCVYVISDGGARPDWMLNLEKTPKCEVWLPESRWEAKAVPIHDARERLLRIREVLQNSGFAAEFLANINPLTISDEDLRKQTADVKVVRLDLEQRIHGKAPGDLGWILPTLGVGVAAGLSLWGFKGRHRPND